MSDSASEQENENEEVSAKEQQQQQQQLKKLRAANAALEKELKKGRADLSVRNRKYRQEQQAKKHPKEAEASKLADLTMVYKALGIEVVHAEEDGLAVTYHHWHEGKIVTANSVAIRKQADGKLVVVRHSLPSGLVPWLQNVPCPVPRRIGSSMEEVLRYLKEACFHWNNRHLQLEDFKKQHRDVCVSYYSDLSIISMAIFVYDNKKKKQKIKVDVTLKYEVAKPYPTAIEVTCVSKLATDAAAREVEEILVRDLEPFKTMDMCSAYILTFTPKSRFLSF